MKVYVEEKDIDVIECLFDATHCYECWECNRDDNLEIVSLADYTKQVRKEVCEQVKTELLDISHEYWRVFKQNGKQYMTSDDMAEYLDVILDQIQGETNG